MTGSLISLFSITVGILGSLLFGLLNKKYSFGIVSNTIVGAFGSILILKTFGKLGFDAGSIIAHDSIAINLLIINLTVSFLAGAGSLWLLFYLTKKLNR